MTTSYHESFLKMKSMYENEETFWHLLIFCLNNGIVYSDEELFLCAYTTDCSEVNNIQTKYKKLLDTNEVLHVCMLSGKINKAYELCKDFDFVSFYRMDKNLRVVETRRFRHG